MVDENTERIAELRERTLKGLKAFKYDGLVNNIKEAITLMDYLISSMKDEALKQRLITYKGELEATLKKSDDYTIEKMMAEFENVIGNIPVSETPGGEGRPSEGMDAFLTQMIPHLAKAVDLELKEEKDLKQIEDIESDVLETLKEGKGEGKRFFRQIDNINRMMKVIKQRDDKEREKIKRLLGGFNVSSILELKKLYKKAEEDYEIIGKQPGKNTPKALKKKKEEAEEGREVYKGALSQAKKILELRRTRLDRVLRRVTWIEEIYEKNQKAFILLETEIRKFIAYHNELARSVISIHESVHNLLPYKPFTDALDESWAEFKNDDVFKEEENPEQALSHLSEYATKLGKTIQSCGQTLTVVMNDEANLKRMMDGLKAKLASSITEAKEMLDGKIEVKIDDLPIAGSDDPVLKNFNQAVFNMRDHLPDLVTSVKNFIIMTSSLRGVIYLIDDVVSKLAEGIQKAEPEAEPEAESEEETTDQAA